MTTWTEEMRAELMNLFHLARTAMAGERPSRHAQKIWASGAYNKAHPEVSSTAAYKEICREEAWRYNLDPDPPEALAFEGGKIVPKRKWKDRCLVCGATAKVYNPDLRAMEPCPYCKGTGYRDGG